MLEAVGVIWCPQEEFGVVVEVFDGPVGIGDGDYGAVDGDVTFTLGSGEDLSSEETSVVFLVEFPFLEVLSGKEEIGIHRRWVSFRG